ncbi:MAG: haloalkane dehalogenase [Myxococcota bacterium]
MESLRTPDSRFENLPGYDFEPHYAEVDGLRMHYVDVSGPPEVEASGETVVMLHGEPSWSFLYRKMIPIVAKVGHRVIAPDLIGFGRSDKPIHQSDYTYAGHVEWLRTLLFDRLDLNDITLVCQDWGGLLGLRLVGEHPERFRRVVAGNTGLPVGGGAFSAEFDAWLKFSQEAPELPIGGIIAGATTTDLSPEVQAAYDAPFPDETYKAGARVFPLLVPAKDGNPAIPDNEAAWKVLERFEKPFLTAFSDGDPLTKPSEKIFRERIPGAKTQPHAEIQNAGHFLQEDQGEALASVVLGFIRAT